MNIEQAMEWVECSRGRSVSILTGDKEALQTLAAEVKRLREEKRGVLDITQAIEACRYEYKARAEAAEEEVKRLLEELSRTENHYAWLYSLVHSHQIACRDTSCSVCYHLRAYEKGDNNGDT